MLVTVQHIISFMCCKTGQHDYNYGYCGSYWLNVTVSQ